MRAKDTFSQAQLRLQAAGCRYRIKQASRSCQATSKTEPEATRKVSHLAGDRQSEPAALAGAADGGAGVPASGVIPPAPPPLRSRGGARTSGDRLHG
jgi:hypothetical protein